MFEIKPARYLIAEFLRFQGFYALTAPWGAIYILPEIMPVCMCRDPKGFMIIDENNRLIRHERCHEAQMKREGTARFLVKYLWYKLRFGYWDNPYEVEARRVENA